MSINVRQYFDEIAARHVGFPPNTHSVKPVHIANGLFRIVAGGTANVDLLFRFVFSQSQKGKVPNRHHRLEAVHAALVKEGKLDPDEIDREALPPFRSLLKSLVGADNGIFDTSMQSYSAGAGGFLTKETIAQEGGELLAEWMRLQVPELHETVAEALTRTDDTISILCSPLLVGGLREQRVFEGRPVGLLTEPASGAARELWSGLALAGKTLDRHLRNHPNKLMRLRLAVLFGCFVLIRYLFALEAANQRGASVPPLLLDFTGEGGSAVRLASQMSYTRACNSVGRFYAWAFSEELKRNFTEAELLGWTGMPETKSRTCTPEVVRSLWTGAMEEARRSDDPFGIWGQTLYEIVAHEDSGNPIPFLRQLGHRSGLLWPPANGQPNKHFRLQEDMLEVLIRGTIAPGEVVDLPELQSRMLARYGLVVGGRVEDEAILDAGGIYQADANALRQNRDRFAERLGALDFARMLADGVLHVDVGVS